MTSAPVVSVTDDLLAEIELLAGKATPGPWWIDSHGMTMMSMPELQVVFNHPQQGQAVRNEDTGNLSHWRNDWDASFIATANPATMLAITTELRRLRAEVEALRELAEQANVNCRNTAYYLRKYRPDMASICSGWCDAIDTAMQSNTEGN